MTAFQKSSVLPAKPVDGEVTFNLKNGSFVYSGEGTTTNGINIKSDGSANSSYLNLSESSGGQTITITANSPKRIKSIVLTFTGSGNDRTGQMTASTGNYSVSGATGTWTPEEGSTEASVVFTTHNKARVEKIVVTYVVCETLTPAKTYTTLTSAYNLDFTDVDGLKAYIVEDNDASDGVITMTQVNKVPAGTGLVVKKTGSAASFDVPVFDGTGADDVSGNKMEGSATATTHIAANGGYILSDGEFHPALEGDLPSGKAYLKITVTSNAPVMSFGDATAIDEVRSKMEDVRGDFYNLNGQRVAQPTKGLYIVNGRKVIMK